MPTHFRVAGSADSSTLTAEPRVREVCDAPNLYVCAPDTGAVRSSTERSLSMSSRKKPTVWPKSIVASSSAGGASHSRERCIRARGRAPHQSRWSQSDRYTRAAARPGERGSGEPAAARRGAKQVVCIPQISHARGTFARAAVPRHRMRNIRSKSRALLARARTSSNGSSGTRSAAAAARRDFRPRLRGGGSFIACSFRGGISASRRETLTPRERERG